MKGNTQHRDIGSGSEVLTPEVRLDLLGLLRVLSLLPLVF